ncbi:MAG TPA: sugar ABC transporter substrate-binding protein [Myxococcaceae bacterium]|nr:sugar ABC transporter substrate-binding protein [Myxococcaceae bacterium]
MNGITTRAVAVLCAVALAGLGALFALRSREAAPSAPGDEVPAALRKRVRIALIMELSSGAHATQYLEGARSEAAALGFSLEVLDARHDRQKMAELLENAVLSQADGIMLSHGDPRVLLKGAQRAVDKGIPLVAFDCELPLPAVNKVDQNDHKIAELGLSRILQDTSGKARLVHIWVPGYAPMDKRMETYTRFVAKHPGLRELERFGKVTNNTSLQTEVAMNELLQKYPRGSIDVVWATWDEFAKGAGSAIRKANRGEIKLYGIDLSDENLALIQDPISPWLATVGVSPAAIGRVQVRMLAYRIAGYPVPERYSLQPVLVSREMLPTNERVTMASLHKYVPGFGDATDFNDAWIQKLKEQSGR